MTSGSVRCRSRSGQLGPPRPIGGKARLGARRSASVFETSSTLPEGVAGIRIENASWPPIARVCAMPWSRSRRPRASWQSRSRSPAERYGAYLCISERSRVLRSDQFHPAVAVGTWQPSVCELDLGQRAWPHLPFAATDGIAVEPALVELSRHRLRHLQTEAATAGMHSHLGVHYLEL